MEKNIKFALLTPNQYFCIEYEQEDPHIIIIDILHYILDAGIR